MTSREAVEHFRRKAQREEIRALISSGPEKKRHMQNAVKLLKMAKRFTGFSVETAAFTGDGLICR